MKLEPVLLEILANKVVAASEEMANALQRTARTLFVKEAADYACALIGVDGRVFAHPQAMGATIFVNMDAGPTIAAVEDLEDGDVIITNDPYLSEGMVTHTPDITLIEPYFHKGRIVAYGWCFVHSTDVGGTVPSSIAPSLSEVYQEGLLIPPMKLKSRGTLNDDVVTILKANSRIPEENMGDLRAMLAGLAAGKKRTAEIIARHGVETFLACQSDLLDYSEAKARAVLKRLPDGVYDFWDYLDDDLVSRVPVRLRLKLEIKNGNVHMDLTGTDPEVRAAYNIATFGRMHEWLTLRFTSFIRTHDKSIILNAGMYRPFTVTNPRGTVINAQFPAAVGLRSNPARRFNDAVTGAILKAAPDLMAAPTPGTQLIFVLCEYDSAGIDRKVVVLEPLAGGMGAFKGSDGVDARDSTMSNMKNNTVESIEHDHGILVREFDIRPDSGGAGRWRGGCGQTFTVEILRDGGLIVPRGMERMRFQAFGVMGGRPSAPFRIVINKGRPDERMLAKCDQFAVNRGDLITVDMPGASGYGDPYLRDPEATRRDVELGFVTREGARRDYGVVIAADGAVDLAATKAERARRPNEAGRPDFDFGPEREAWERVFDDATMNDMVRRLFRMPKAVRYDARQRVFAAAVPDLPRPGEPTTLVQVLKDPAATRARLKRAMDDILGPANAPPRAAE